MKILADVNIEAALVAWLRIEGHEVTWATDLPPSTSDEYLLQLSNEFGSVLLTYDKDFGELVFRRRLVAHGIVLLRFSAGLQSARLGLLQRHWPSILASAQGHFMVVTDEQARVRPITNPNL